VTRGAAGRPSESKVQNLSALGKTEKPHSREKSKKTLVSSGTFSLFQETKRSFFRLSTSTSSDSVEKPSLSHKVTKARGEESPILLFVLVVCVLVSFAVVRHPALFDSIVVAGVAQFFDHVSNASKHAIAVMAASISSPPRRLYAKTARILHVVISLPRSRRFGVWSGNSVEVSLV
jgi:hypothetical protein